MTRANVFTGRAEYDETDPEGYRSGVAQVGQLAGGRSLNVKAYELPPNQSICPYHYEYEEEWLVVLDGEVLLRTPEGEETLARGAIVCFPPGPSGAHKAVNQGADTARVLMFSRAREPAVAVYPDSDKIGVWPGNRDDVLMRRRGDGNVTYFDGEV